MFYNGCKVADGAVDAGKAILGIGRFASGARIAFSGLNTIAGGLSIAGVVFDSVAIPFDLFVIIKGSYDIHKHRTGRGSNSNKANKLALMIKELKEHRDKIKKEFDIQHVEDTSDNDAGTSTT